MFVFFSVWKSINRLLDNFSPPIHCLLIKRKTHITKNTVKWLYSFDGFVHFISFTFVLFRFACSFVKQIRLFIRTNHHVFHTCTQKWNALNHSIFLVSILIFARLHLHFFLLFFISVKMSHDSWRLL